MVGVYSYEAYICKDDETGASIKLPEDARFRSLFVCGGSGTGKTSLIFEPLIARDLEKKYCYFECTV